MPMKPVAPESTAPMKNPIATDHPRKYAKMKKITIPTRPIVVYWRLR